MSLRRAEVEGRNMEANMQVREVKEGLVVVCFVSEEKDFENDVVCVGDPVDPGPGGVVDLLELQLAVKNYAKVSDA